MNTYVNGKTYKIVTDRFGGGSEVYLDGKMIGWFCKTSPNGNRTPHSNAFLFYGFYVFPGSNHRMEDTRLYPQNYFKTEAEAIKYIINRHDQATANK